MPDPLTIIAGAGLALQVFGGMFGARKERGVARSRAAAAREGANIELALNAILRDNLASYEEGLAAIYGDLEESYEGELLRKEREFFERMALAVRRRDSTDDLLDSREALAFSAYGDHREESVRRWQIAENARHNGHEIAERFGERALQEYRNINGRLSAQSILRGQQRELATVQRDNLLGFAAEERRIEGALLDAEGLEALADAESGLEQARTAAQVQDENRYLALGEQTAKVASSGLVITGQSTLQRRDFAEARMLRAKQSEQLQIMRQVGKALNRAAMVGVSGSQSGQNVRYMEQVEMLRSAALEYGAGMAREDGGGVSRARQFIEKVDYQIQTYGVRRQQSDLRFLQQINAIEDGYARQQIQFDSADVADRFAALSANLQFKRAQDQQQQVKFQTEQQWLNASTTLFARDRAAMRAWQQAFMNIEGARRDNIFQFEESELALGSAWAAAQEVFNRREIDLTQRRLSDEYNLGNRWAGLDAADERARLQYKTGGIYALQADMATLGGWTSALSSILGFAATELEKSNAG